MSRPNSLSSTPSPSTSTSTSPSISPSRLPSLPRNSPTLLHHPPSPSLLSQPTTPSPPPSTALSPSPPPTTLQPPSATHPRPKRPVTLYDAVAGRITTSGFLGDHSHSHSHADAPYTHSHANARYTRAHEFASRHRDTASSSLVPLPPEEVLFRRKRAPTRYLDAEGGDWYFADEREPGVGDGNGLPGSGLVGAVHGYVSGFYAGVFGRGGGGGDNGDVLGGRGRWGGGDWRSMDETALLAVGVLLEEEVRGVLGGSGDLVFVEGEGEGFGEGRKVRKEEERWRGGEGSGKVKRERKKERVRKGVKGRNRKRRKIGGDETGGEAKGNGDGFALEESGRGLMVGGGLCVHL